MMRLQFSAPSIKSLRRKVDTLERRVDAAFERGALEAAEEMDVQLAELRERLTSAAAELLEDEESFEAEAGLEEQLAEAYHAYHKMANGRPFGPFNTRVDAIENNATKAILAVAALRGCSIRRSI